MKPAATINSLLLLAAFAAATYTAVESAHAEEPIDKAIHKQLHDADEPTCLKGIEVIHQYYSIGRRIGAVNSLAFVLEHSPSAKVRMRTAEILEEIGPSAQAAVPALAKALKDKDKRVRYKAVEALMQIGLCGEYAIPALVEALEDDDVHFRRKLVVAISLIRAKPKLAVPALIRALKDKDTGDAPGQASVAYAAVTALGNYGPAAAPAVPALLEATRSKYMTLRRLALVSLARIGAQPAVIVPLMIRTLEDKDQSAVRSAAAAALGVIGMPAKGAVPHLIKVYDSKMVTSAPDKEIIQGNILRALGRIGADAKIVVPFLLKTLKDKRSKSQVKNAALLSIASFGPAAKDAVPSLIDLLSAEEDYSIGQDLVFSLVAIGKDAVGHLEKNLTTTNEMARFRTIQALGQLGKTAAPAAATLRKIAADDPDMGIRNEAARALGKIGG